jgi:putative hydrolase of the HAD superfamily
MDGYKGGRKLGMEGIVFTDYETGKKKLERMLSEK